MAGKKITLTTERQTPALTEQELDCVRRIRERARDSAGPELQSNGHPWRIAVALAATALAIVGLALSLI